MTGSEEHGRTDPSGRGARQRVQLAVKRLIDAVCGSAGLVLASPLLLGVAVFIRGEDGGPVIYRGLRVGKDGRAFRMYKLRTMAINADSLGGSTTPNDDPRLLRCAGWIRRYKLDELPQLWNVVKGEMSLVGPRPQVVSDVAKYSAAERRLLSVRPGITDFASVEYANEGELVSGFADPDQAYIDLIRPNKIRLGLVYVDSWTLLTDFRIIWMTLRAIVVPRRGLVRAKTS